LAHLAYHVDKCGRKTPFINYINDKRDNLSYTHTPDICNIINVYRYELSLSLSLSLSVCVCVCVGG